VRIVNFRGFPATGLGGQTNGLSVMVAIPANLLPSSAQYDQRLDGWASAKFSARVKYRRWHQDQTCRSPNWAWACAAIGGGPLGEGGRRRVDGARRGPSSWAYTGLTPPTCTGRSLGKKILGQLAQRRDRATRSLSPPRRLWYSAAPPNGKFKKRMLFEPVEASPRAGRGGD